jgi:hypothetical protein
MVVNRTFVLCLTLGVCLFSAVALVGQRSGEVSERHPAIEYRTRPTTDPVVELNRRIADGHSELKHDPVNGYLRAVLDALKVPVESQMLVFSQTSLQSEHITKETPRALYFNDQVAIGWTKGADSIEVAAQDPQQGVVFYVLSQTAAQLPHFSRSQRCLECHESAATLNVPGLLSMSMLPMSDDPNEYAVGWAVEHRTPIDERWGGWYVTGAATPAKHLGNVPVYHVNKAGTRMAIAPKLTSVNGVFDTTSYLSLHSDIAALMVFNHQTYMTNLITRLNWMTRVEDYERQAGVGLEAAGPAAAAKANPDTVGRLASELVDYMLFIDEAPLTTKVQGGSGFAEKFGAAGLRDSKGRSLRDLDLEKRLLKYPCSYLIYSEAFDALPARAKAAVYDRLREVLSGKATDKAYARLSATDRQAIIEILRETKKGLPSSFHAGHRGP